MRTIIWFIYFWLYLLFLWPKMHKAKKLTAAGDIAGADAIAQHEVPHWAGSLLHLAGMSITTTGLENLPQDEAVVFVANHRSYYDIPVMLTQLGSAPALVSKIEVKKIPLIRMWMQFLHCVFLDRNNPRQAVAAMNEASDNLHKGYSVVIFPEGTRSKGEEKDLLEFKAGAFRIATKAKAKIVPVVLHNTRNAMENNGGWMKPAHITVDILPAIDTAGMDKDAQRALPEAVQKLIAEKLATL